MEAKFEKKKDVLLTKDDRLDFLRTIYMVGLGQFLAIVGAVLAILHFQN